MTLSGSALTNKQQVRMNHLEQENQELVQYLKEANADNEVLNQ